MISFVWQLPHPDERTATVSACGLLLALLAFRDAFSFGYPTIVTSTFLRPNSIASALVGTNTSTLRPLILPPTSPTRYSPDHGPAPVMRTRVPIGSTRGSAAIVFPATGFFPSAVKFCEVYANAVNLTLPWRAIGCLCSKPETDAQGTSPRPMATSSFD